MDTHARFAQFVEKHVDQAEYGEEGRRGSLLSRLNTWVDYNHRQKKFEVAGLVIKKSRLDYGMCFSNENMLEKYVLFPRFITIHSI